MSAPNGCIGKCCIVFDLTSGTPYEKLQSAENHQRSVIAAMLKPLSLEEARERTERFAMGEPAEGVQHYSCRHWDEDTRLCKIYEARPLMCSEYPYRGEPCVHEGCGFIRPEDDAH